MESREAKEKCVSLELKAQGSVERETDRQRVGKVKETAWKPKRPDRENERRLQISG